MRHRGSRQNWGWKKLIDHWLTENILLRNHGLVSDIGRCGRAINTKPRQMTFTLRILTKAARHCASCWQFCVVAQLWRRDDGLVSDIGRCRRAINTRPRQMTLTFHSCWLRIPGKALCRCASCWRPWHIVAQLGRTMTWSVSYKFETAPNDLDLMHSRQSRVPLCFMLANRTKFENSWSLTLDTGLCRWAIYIRNHAKWPWPFVRVGYAFPPKPCAAVQIEQTN